MAFLFPPLQTLGKKPVPLRLPVVLDGGLDGSVPGGDLRCQVRGTQEDAQEKTILTQTRPTEMLR